MCGLFSGQFTGLVFARLSVLDCAANVKVRCLPIVEPAPRYDTDRRGERVPPACKAAKLPYGKFGLQNGRLLLLPSDATPHH
jgi:hypothetical protein